MTTSTTFTPGGRHCHYSYALPSGYRSPWHWPTEAQATHAAQTVHQITEGIQVISEHVANCLCDTPKEAAR